MIEESLAKLGFSPSEIKIYLNLINTGSGWANKISSDTNINRTNVYEALDRLVSKGVVVFVTKNKVKWYEAKKLGSIIDLVSLKEEEFAHIKEQLLSDIKRFKVAQKHKNPLEANIFAGKKGLRIIFEEILDEGKPISIIASQLQFKDLFGAYFELWHKRRAQMKIKQRSIFPYKFKDKLEEKPLLEYKFVDNKFTNPTTTIIYGDNCLFIQWSKDPIAIKIQNKSITKSHLNYFNILWNS